jgi:hypothetical protein
LFSRIQEPLKHKDVWKFTKFFKFINSKNHQLTFLWRHSQNTKSLMWPTGWPQLSAFDQGHRKRRGRVSYDSTTAHPMWSSSPMFGSDFFGVQCGKPAINDPQQENHPGVVSLHPQIVALKRLGFTTIKQFKLFDRYKLAK